jgi:hypothetical protein
MIWKKYGTARQATDDITIWRMRLACWKTEAVDTLSGLVILSLFHGKNALQTRLNFTLYVHRLHLFFCKKITADNPSLVAVTHGNAPCLLIKRLKIMILLMRH